MPGTAIFIAERCRTWKSWLSLPPQVMHADAEYAADPPMALVAPDCLSRLDEWVHRTVEFVHVLHRPGASVDTKIFGEVVIRYIYLFSERFLGLVAQIPYLEHFLKLRAFSTSERMFGTDRAILALFPESLGPSVPCAAFQCAHQHVCIAHATGIDFGGIPAVAGMFR